MGVFFGSQDANFYSFAGIDPRHGDPDAKIEDAIETYVLGYEADTGHFRLYSTYGIGHDVFQVTEGMPSEAGAFIEMSCEGSIPW